MSNHKNKSPINDGDVFTVEDRPLSIGFITNSMLAGGTALFLLLYILIASTRSDLAALNGNERVNDMIEEAKTLDSSVNGYFLKVADRALADKKVTSTEMAVIDTEYKAMLVKRDSVNAVDRELLSDDENYLNDFDTGSPQE